MEHRTVRGISVPRLLYGTAWKEERTEPLTGLALRQGFRGIDTANQRRHYVEAAVGAAVQSAIGSSASTRASSSRDQSHAELRERSERAEGGGGSGREASRGGPRPPFVNSGSLSCEDVFLQTKFTFAGGQDHRIPYDPSSAPSQQVRASFESSLEHLGTSYVDSYVLHGPSSRDGLTAADWGTWRAMEALHLDGKVRLLGVSNVSLAQLTLLEKDALVKPAFVQNRCYASTGWDRDVRAFATKRDIVYQGFSLLTANGRALGSPEVRRIAERVGRTVAQVTFRFALQVGMIPLTGTSSEEHMREDLAALDFELDPKELRAIETIEG